ncbi:hypothetical protein [Alicyclobacillus acidocaldarius]|uniref:Uncharacterized protein n=1 Tax=Alicyclobacillus acidocaldarius subsp. acidocaldarius (strain ATCC 27009 / DSM 446 / BCRC 14685 / JCM 5260 / KCTC 1825 / NBRC 15652 / NCIMB 11725 / NRRL B-14509 / 104-IA) TaxID=521098 RepID=C8WRC7_ALIAD|nr:hypothetical protein [Alicyclobacillus acidocaldarius]ACV57332.1 hypothetical protein Aaci_0270 [Alicyclobacillus acidocaldarius subsp. acidocaldarius DSM 446]
MTISTVTATGMSYNLPSETNGGSPIILSGQQFQQELQAIQTALEQLQSVDRSPSVIQPVDAPPTNLPTPYQAYWTASQYLALNQDGLCETQQQEIHQDLVIAGEDQTLITGELAALLGNGVQNGQTALVGYAGHAYYVTNRDGQIYAGLVPDPVSPSANA